MKAIIGGTGVDRISHFHSESKEVSTPYGPVELFVGSGEHSSLIFLPRHGSSHSVPPHLINYRANISALKQLGVDELISIYAVGSISDALKPGEIGTLSDFVDLSGGGRLHTFFTGEESGVKHVGMDEAFDRVLTASLHAEDPSLKKGGVYVCTNGPRLETPREIRMFASLGFDVVGMTAATEIALAREVGIRVASLAYSINWAAGIGGADVEFIGDEEIGRLKDRMISLCLKVLGE
ncbi:MAG: MTAP family purine nucleoside phosphorylase [Sphaerochaeta sp.]|jgi:purine nucleoside phosphorylase|nr:MTAP family purine nucleoside phosphorylase [Spirochaetales bacterium]